jgi:predicted sulfurtransferase/23S rRNA-/tRNA-specific pseudouridylate synthase
MDSTSSATIKSTTLHNQTSIVLFYRYHPLSSDPTITEIYRSALETLCQSLNLRGRILVAHSACEGINGTLAGSSSHVNAFSMALMGYAYYHQFPIHNATTTTIAGSIAATTTTTIPSEIGTELYPILQTFWTACQQFSNVANVPILTMSNWEDFKWSTTNQPSVHIFPDLRVKMVRELISTGGLLSDIPIEQTSQGYLTPQQWHQALLTMQHSDDISSTSTSSAILLDCRNTKECQIGHFSNAIDPGTTTFSQFPQWVRDNIASLQNKNVYMYCTGGIRCEKASAYIRNTVPTVQGVYHLKGGIHKYIDEFPNDNSLWKGKNFVFDGRLSQEQQSNERDEQQQQQSKIVGQCLYCSEPYDTFLPNHICTACREPCLVCPSCRNIPEFHCRKHFHLRTCYFQNLNTFSTSELQSQLQQLEQYLNEIAVGKSFKQRRKTLIKQCDKIKSHILDKNDENHHARDIDSNPIPEFSSCRSCGDSNCSGSCWGFHGLQRKKRLEMRHEMAPANPDLTAKVTSLPTTISTTTTSLKSCRQGRNNAGQRISKQRQRTQRELDIQQLGLSNGHFVASQHRNDTTGIRILPPYVRCIETNVKGRWCGKSVIKIIQEEFVDVANDLDNILNNGLLHVNDIPIHNDEDRKLKNMDVIQRYVHWHEPPVIIPPVIIVQRIPLPDSVITEYKLPHDSTILVCDKPATLPTHPTGPFLANSLTMIVKAQEGLENIYPCHRLDRATSGLTICASDANVARIIQGKMSDSRKSVQKVYIAKVHGQFLRRSSPMKCTSNMEITFIDRNKIGSPDILVNATIGVEDATSGKRTICSADYATRTATATIAGKEAKSRFRFVQYLEEEDCSLVLCFPITGRAHQLRVHLMALGYPIVGDILYGGSTAIQVSDSVTLDNVLSHMCESSNQSKELINHACTTASEYDKSVNVDGSVNMKRIVESCRICRDGQQGVLNSFNNSQLLQGGHSIYLFAFRYDITFRFQSNATKKKRKTTTPLTKTTDPDFFVLDVLKLEIDLPSWASAWKDSILEKCADIS